MATADVERIEERLRGKVQEMTLQREGRLFARTVRKNLKEAIKELMGLEGFSHLSTITGLEIGPEIEVIYHFSFKDTLVSLRVQVSKKSPVLPSIVDLIPGAVLYEREVHDLFGVNFRGHPDLSPLLLPDGWPDGVYPLRKWWTQERISKRLRDVR